MATMPDAWDDDWIVKTDTKTAKPESSSSSAKISKAERRRQQAEFNKQIWERENSDRPEDNFFLQSQGIVPLKSDFKPQMKVLSRKPTKPVGGTDPNTAIESLNIDDDDEEEEDAAKVTMTAEERQQKAQREREEKQKAYEERRRELFGNKESNVTSSKHAGKGGSPRNQSRVKGTSGSRPSSAAGFQSRQLYDPNESVKPDSLRPQSRPIVQQEGQPTREPRAPDGSGRGGFGFAPRGGRTT